MSDKEILDTITGGIAVRDMSGITFLGWLANKINGVPAYTAATQELRMAVSGGYFGTMPEAEKVRLVRKLIDLNLFP